MFQRRFKVFIIELILGWEIIEYSLSQKLSDVNNFFFPKINIDNYEIAFRYFNDLNFYECDKD